MTTHRPAAALACLAVACCVPPAPEPTPAPPTAPVARATPNPAPSTSVTLPVTNWIDAPQTLGDWRYTRVDGGSMARFETADRAVFGVGCMAGSQRVALLRYGVPAAADLPMIVRTETADRTLDAKPSNDGQAVSAALSPRDPLLDAMAFTRGRFAVEALGSSPLYLPSWPEVSRVIEDCR